MCRIRSSCCKQYLYCSTSQGHGHNRRVWCRLLWAIGHAASLILALWKYHRQTKFDFELCLCVLLREAQRQSSAQQPADTHNSSVRSLGLFLFYMHVHNVREATALETSAARGRWHDTETWKLKTKPARFGENLENSAQILQCKRVKLFLIRPNLEHT